MPSTPPASGPQSERGRAMLIGENGPAVVIGARTAAFLERHADLTGLRVRVRGLDPEISQELADLRVAALTWRGSATGTTVAAKPELAAGSEWLSTGQAARLVGITGRAIRKAIYEKRLEATEVSGRYRISREDLEQFRAARAAGERNAG